MVECAVERALSAGMPRPDQNTSMYLAYLSAFEIDNPYMGLHTCQRLAV